MQGGFVSLSLAWLVATSACLWAQEVSIPDRGLDIAIRENLGKPTGPLTVEDLLTLTSLDTICGFGGPATPACYRPKIASLEGLGDAHNLTFLALKEEGLTNLTVPSGLTNLTELDISGNPLVELTVPGQLTKLTQLWVQGNQLTNVTLSAGLNSLGRISLAGNALRSVTLPPGLTSLINLDLSHNGLTNLTLAGDLPQLVTLNLSYNAFWKVSFLSALSSLTWLDLSENPFYDASSGPPPSNYIVSLIFPAGLTNLTYLGMSGASLNKLLLPPGLTSLTNLDLRYNRLTDLSTLTNLVHLTALSLAQGYYQILPLPPGLTSLASLNLDDNNLQDFSFLTALTNLAALSVKENGLVSLALPESLSELSALDLDGNPLRTLVLPEAVVASRRLAAWISSYRSQGVSVYTRRPLITAPARAASPFEFSLTAPPGLYTVLSSTNLRVWTDQAVLTNQLGSAAFEEPQTAPPPQKFYRALSGIITTQPSASGPLTDHH